MGETEHWTLRHAYRLQMTCFLAEAENSFNVGTSFAKMSRISTPEAGGFLFLRFGSFGLCVAILAASSTS